MLSTQEKVSKSLRFRSDTDGYLFRLRGRRAQESTRRLERTIFPVFELHRSLRASMFLREGPSLAVY